MPKPVKPTLFKHFPDEPGSDLCQNAFVILCNAHDASSAFLEIFDAVRLGRGAIGMPTDEEQDLLRAMLLFASAGLDSFVKQLIREALPAVIDRSEGAREMFTGFVEKRLRNPGGIDHIVLAEVITQNNPRSRLLELLVWDMTAKSLQSADELFKAAAAFDIPTRDISANPEYLKEIFRARNQIAHEMDVDFTRPNRSRRPRSKSSMVRYTNELFFVAKSFLRGIEGKLR